MARDRDRLRGRFYCRREGQGCPVGLVAPRSAKARSVLGRLPSGGSSTTSAYGTMPGTWAVHRIRFQNVIEVIEMTAHTAAA
jgi:hypothetical protein